MISTRMRIVIVLYVILWMTGRAISLVLELGDELATPCVGCGGDETERERQLGAAWLAGATAPRIAWTDVGDKPPAP